MKMLVVSRKISKFAQKYCVRMQYLCTEYDYFLID